MALRALAAIGAGIVLTAAVWLWQYEGRVQQTAKLAFGDGSLCWFDGIYEPSGMPVAIVPPRDSNVVRPWQDFTNSVLVSDGAKPFHFGVLVTPSDGKPIQVWGWSYRKAAFWPDPDGHLFALAYLGAAGVDCVR